MDSTTTTITPEQIKEVKSLGFLHNRGTRCFNGRIITKNGVLTSEQLECIANAAHKFGNGTAAFTVRLTVEVPGIDFDNIEPFRKYIASTGLKTGGTGKRVRPVVACKGTTCVFGLCDTQKLAAEIHERFYEGYREVVLPHKFKIAVGGCPNNCAKPDLNDVGIVGQRVVKFDTEKCKGCKKCKMTKDCPMKALSVPSKEDKLKREDSVCNNCGRCLESCPFGVSKEYQDMYRVYIGGRWGKQIRIGNRLDVLFTKDEIMNIVEKCIILFRDRGEPGERFGETIDRIGIEEVQRELLK